MLPGDFFLVRLHPRDFREIAAFEDEGYEVRDRITHYNRDFTEDFWVLRKPLEVSVVSNVLTYGVGGLNIDGCRIEGDVPSCTGQGFKTGKYGGTIGWGDTTLDGQSWEGHAQGRWPAHTVFSHNEDCGDHCTAGCIVKQLDGQSGIRKSGTGAVKKSTAKGFQGNAYGKESRKVGEAMISYGDAGGASRYFFCGKPSDVYSWLATLISRPT